MKAFRHLSKYTKIFLKRRYSLSIFTIDFFEIYGIIINVKR
uniref:Uncharacterized protein n=1 Tax=Siphoviridae sp. ctTnV63 TaxID=2825523 RepID=A0A8S5NV15_9CAUD|nr:MAG TPA: hypothetical protein [Siphoviridae sp. ctTnV63]